MKIRDYPLEWLLLCLILWISAVVTAQIIAQELRKGKLKDAPRMIKFLLLTNPFNLYYYIKEVSE